MGASKSSWATWLYSSHLLSCRKTAPFFSLASSTLSARLMRSFRSLAVESSCTMWVQSPSTSLTPTIRMPATTTMWKRPAASFSLFSASMRPSGPSSWILSSFRLGLAGTSKRTPMGRPFSLMPPALFRSLWRVTLKNCGYRMIFSLSQEPWSRRSFAIRAGSVSPFTSQMWSYVVTDSRTLSLFHSSISVSSMTSLIMRWSGPFVEKSSLPRLLRYSAFALQIPMPYLSSSSSLTSSTSNIMHLSSGPFCSSHERSTVCRFLLIRSLSCLMASTRSAGRSSVRVWSFLPGDTCSRGEPGGKRVDAVDCAVTAKSEPSDSPPDSRARARSASSSGGA
mmetsp:Transcript_74100/g.217122  ORF Transcript_74100/g.217122 Transcript_74100/m.217122 type:complete len:337 (+) Transcript_74100:235-1245(+)